MDNLSATLIKAGSGSTRPAGSASKFTGPDYRKRSIAFLTSAILFSGAGLAHWMGSRPIHRAHRLTVVKSPPVADPWRQLCSKHSPIRRPNGRVTKIPSKLAISDYPYCKRCTDATRLFRLRFHRMAGPYGAALAPVWI